MRIILVVLIAAVLLQESSAMQGRAGTFAVYGPVKVSCGGFSASSGAQRQNIEWWVLGFLSGVGHARDEDGVRPLRNTDPEAAKAYVAKYCADHPLDTFVLAALSLVKELEQKNPRQIGGM